MSLLEDLKSNKEMSSYRQKDAFLSAKRIIKRYRNLDKGLSSFVAEWVRRKQRDKTGLSSVCFLPLAGYEHLCRNLTLFDDSMDIRQHILTIAALSPYYYTRHNYMMDIDFFSEVTSSPYKAKLPIEIFKKFPNFGIYVGFNQWPVVYSGGDDDSEDFEMINGIFLSVHKEDDNIENRNMVLLVALDLVCWNRKENKIRQGLNILPVPLLDGKTLRESREITKNPYILENSNIDADIKGYSKYVSLALYLCCASFMATDINPSVKLHPFRLAKGKIKRGAFQLLPPLRAKNYSIITEKSESENEQLNSFVKASTNPMRPHIRRAHWHGFWSGPRDGEREFNLKWIPPTVIAANSGYVDTVMIN